MTASCLILLWTTTLPVLQRAWCMYYMYAGMHVLIHMHTLIILNSLSLSLCPSLSLPLSLLATRHAHPHPHAQDSPLALHPTWKVGGIVRTWRLNWPQQTTPYQI